MTTLKKLNSKYSQISSLDQLISERDKLDVQMQVKEMTIRHEWNMTKNSFSFWSLLDMVSYRFSGVGAIVNGIMDGYNLVSSLFSSKRRKKGHK